jgi:hypothetical protein
LASWCPPDADAFARSDFDSLSTSCAVNPYAHSYVDSVANTGFYCHTSAYSQATDADSDSEPFARFYFDCLTDTDANTDALAKP